MYVRRLPRWNAVDPARDAGVSMPAAAGLSFDSGVWSDAGLGHKVEEGGKEKKGKGFLLGRIRRITGRNN